MTQYFPKPRPDLTVEQGTGRSLGHCYTQSSHLVTCLFRLSAKQLNSLTLLGVLGIGQEFEIKSQCDGKEEPGLIVKSELTEFDAQDNPVEGEPTGRFTEYKYYTYTVLRRCDSSG